MLKITTHTIVKNEDKWAGYVLESVRPLVTEMLVADDHSTDKTVEVIKSIVDPKIKFSRVNLENPAAHTALRNKMVGETKTDWFMVLDGDEVWNQSVLEKALEFMDRLPKEVYGVVVAFRNCVGDVWHYLPEGSGEYQLLGRKGNLTIRFYRKLPGFRWVGDYPLETYTDINGIPINDQPQHLRFFDGHYWHLTHLSRSSAADIVKGWRKTKIETGIPVPDRKELPEVFDKITLQRRSFSFEIVAGMLTPLRKAKRIFLK